MPTLGKARAELTFEAREVYVRTLEILADSRIPFLVGGAYGFARYANFERHTKDLDVFVRRRDLEPVLNVLQTSGYRTELRYPHWLAKAFYADHFIDIIFSSGNGIAVVDDEWFERAVSDEVLTIPVLLAPPEEMIWSKAFVMERERFDGADIAHLIREVGHKLDWGRLVDRFGPHWRVLLSHLLLFGFVYPSERGQVPASVLRGLLARVEQELTERVPSEKVCQGTFLSREQYLTDVSRDGYRDARLTPAGNLSPDQIATWTAAIIREEEQ